jgi:hypothetical protein
MKKQILSLAVVIVLALCSACSEAVMRNTGKEVMDAVSGVTDANNKYVLMVKNGYRENNPELTYDKAFSAFFGTPRWSYFKSDDGLDVVEFTGDCVYADVEVKARIQFVVDEDEWTFEATYLSFNEVPQDMLTLAILIETVFEGDDSTPSANAGTDVISATFGSVFEYNGFEYTIGDSWSVYSNYIYIPVSITNTSNNTGRPGVATQVWSPNGIEVGAGIQGDGYLAGFPDMRPGASMGGTLSFKDDGDGVYMLELLHFVGGDSVVDETITLPIYRNDGGTVNSDSGDVPTSGNDSGDDWVTVEGVTFPSSWAYDTWRGVEIWPEDGSFRMHVLWSTEEDVKWLHDNAHHVDPQRYDDGGSGWALQFSDYTAWHNGNTVLYFYHNGNHHVLSGEILSKIVMSLKDS